MMKLKKNFKRRKKKHPRGNIIQYITEVFTKCIQKLRRVITFLQSKNMLSDDHLFNS